MRPTIRQMMEAGVHFGHQTRRWNPKMRPYIFDARNGIHIIDLMQTQSKLQQACDYLKQSSKTKRNILFVGSKRQACEIIESEARRCNSHFINRRWLGGLLTNFETIRSRIARLNELIAMKESGEFFRRPKKELAVLNRELFKLERSLGGLRVMRGKPDILIVCDQTEESLAVSEAMKTGCVTICMVDTNSNPDGIDYVIPANDDSIRSIRLITRVLADAILNEEDNDFQDPFDDTDPDDPQPSGVPKQPLPQSSSTEVTLALPSP